MTNELYSPEGEKKEEKKRKNMEPEDLVSDELIRWMTEGTSPNNVPRSDCG
jgi:hypothetical protein|tara:strand:- start:535 stop:687 length:153 start_codon:yes stop_codon:yes gene_type:complete